MTKWNSRKFWTAMIWQILFSVFLWFGKLPPGTYETLSFITLGGYLAANVMEKKFLGGGPT